MLKPFLLLSTLVVAGAVIASPQASQAPPSASAPSPEFKVPTEAASQVNPVKSSPESLARGKKIYGYECSACHGDDGAGTGDLAKHMKAKMPDFHDRSSLKDQTDGALFYIIKSGKGEMEGEGGRVKPEDIWNLVNYVRSFSGAQPAVATGPA